MEFPSASAPAPPSGPPPPATSPPPGSFGPLKFAPSFAHHSSQAAATGGNLLPVSRISASRTSSTVRPSAFARAATRGGTAAERPGVRVIIVTGAGETRVTLA